MTFISLPYALLFLLSFFLYYVVPKNLRKWLLILASCIFYGSSNLVYFSIFVALIVINYLLVRALENLEGRGRGHLLASGLAVDLGFLFGFKYLNFFNETLKEILINLDINYTYTEENILLPLGISFYTFQLISSLVDVYRGEELQSKNFWDWFLFISFFPQIVAGPIERQWHLVPQLKRISGVEFKYENVVSGLYLLMWGLFKKVVIANNISIIVEVIYSRPGNYAGFPVIVAAYLYTLQIYSDFSGYTDIARGCSRVFGIELFKNFEAPFFSRSLTEFWNRWHISFSIWIRDYVFFPLSFNPFWRMPIVLVIVVSFMLSGLWHGANWTFVWWGGIHGAVLSVESILKKSTIPSRLNFSGLGFMKFLITFHVVVVSFVFFRAHDLTHALNIFKSMIGSAGFPAEVIHYFGERGVTMVFMAIALSLFVQVSEYYKLNIFGKIRGLALPMRWILYFSSSLVIVLFGNYYIGEFIYFNF